MGDGSAKEPEMKGWLHKWTNYLKGYQKRLFVLQNGALSYYRNATEMAHTCRGSISLHGALIYTEDTCNFVVSNGGTQTFHLRASSEVERQRWVTALELGKAKAIRTMESEEDEEYEETCSPLGDSGGDTSSTLFRSLFAKLEDMTTCSELIGKHGAALTKTLGEVEGAESGGELVGKIKKVNEKATLFRITTAAMITACTEYTRTAQMQAKKWQKAVQYEKEQRMRLEKVVEELAKQHTKLEEAAAVIVHHESPPHSSQPLDSRILSQIDTHARGYRSDEDDDYFYDAVEGEGGSSAEFTVDIPRGGDGGSGGGTGSGSHRRTGSGVSTDSGKSEGGGGGGNSSSEEGEGGGGGGGRSTAVRCIRSTKVKQLDSGSRVLHPVPPLPSSDSKSGLKSRRRRVADKPNYPLNLWSIMKNCIGKELTKIPMPVNFSEPLSMLQRLTEDFEYARILDEAAECTDSCEQLAYVAAFTVSSYATTSVRTGKPFNPLLGETYECDRMDDLGWRCLNEQVSHHPPMAAQYCEGRKWKCWQEFTMSSKFRGKYLQVIPLGIAHLVFNSSGNHYTWRKVTTTVHNIIVGKLWVDQHGEMDIINHKNNEKCHLKYIPYSYFNRDVQRKVTGCVMDSDEKVRWVLNGTWDGKMETCEVLRQKESDKGGKPILELGPARILWERNIPPPESEKYYNFTELACQLNEWEEGVALSDCRRRPDQRLMEEGKWDEANVEKVRLEDKQRAARRKKEIEAESAAAQGMPVPQYEPAWFTKEKDPTSGNVIHVFNNEYWKCKETNDWSRCPDIF